MAACEMCRLDLYYKRIGAVGPCEGEPSLGRAKDEVRLFDRMGAGTNEARSRRLPTALPSVVRQ